MWCEWSAKESFIRVPIAVLGAENSMQYIGLNIEWDLDKESFYKVNHIYYPLNK